MEIKYEPVFGNHKFSNDTCEIAMRSSFGKIIEMTFTQPIVIPEGWGMIAMRRIIRTPSWTVADQKAGRLPEVGAKFLYKDEELCCHYVDSNGEVWANNFKGEVVTPLLREITPIESPEEKASRLREEWCSNALNSASILSGMREYDLKRLGGYIGNIYDALLSGELPVPVPSAGKMVPDVCHALMTLDEAIDHANEKSIGSSQCAAQHAQLAKWLTDYRAMLSAAPKLGGE